MTDVTNGMAGTIENALVSWTVHYLLPMFLSLVVLGLTIGVAFRYANRGKTYASGEWNYETDPARGWWDVRDEDE